MGQHELERLNPRHYAIVDLVLGGHGPKDIAMAVGMTPQAISLIINSPLFQHEVSRRREGINKVTDDQLALAPIKARKILEGAAELAAQTQVNLLGSIDDKVKLNASKEVLDRIFGDKSQQRAPVVILEAGAIQLLHLALKESKDDQENRRRLQGSERVREEEPGGSVQEEVSGGETASAGGVLQTRETGITPELIKEVA